MCVSVRVCMFSFMRDLDGIPLIFIINYFSLPFLFLFPFGLEWQFVLFCSHYYLSSCMFLCYPMAFGYLVSNALLFVQTAGSTIVHVEAIEPRD